MLKQVSIYAENKKGMMRDVTKLLLDHNINILGSVTNDSAEYGIIRMVVSDPDTAMTALKGAGYMCKLTNVLGVEVADEVGNLHHLLATITDSNINVEYIYLSFNRESSLPIMVMAVEDTAEVEEHLSMKGFSVL